jgi:hypothetical protein
MGVVMQGSVSVPANDQIENILDGQRYVRAPADVLGGLYICGSALGLTAELNVGGASVTPPVGVGAQNRFPLVPDDSLVEDWPAEKGDLIQVRAVNTTGGALTMFWRVELDDEGVDQGGE